MPSKRKRCSICDKKLNPAQRIMAKCRCDMYVCSACKADHITACTAEAPAPKIEGTASASTLTEKI